MGECGKLRNEKLNDLYLSPSIVRGYRNEKNDKGGARSNYGEKERFVQGFGGET